MDIWIFGYLDIWIFGYLDILDIWIFGYLGFWDFGILGFWILGFWENWKKITKVIFALVRSSKKKKKTAHLLTTANPFRIWPWLKWVGVLTTAVPGEKGR